MDQITVVSYQGTLRVQRGHTDVDGQSAYLDGLRAVVGDEARFTHIDLYSDVGDSTSVYDWTYTVGNVWQLSVASWSQIPHPRVYR